MKQRLLKILGIALQIIGTFASIGVVAFAVMVFPWFRSSSPKINHITPDKAMFVLHWGQIGDKSKIRQVRRTPSRVGGRMLLASLFVLLPMALFGRSKQPISDVRQGSRNLPQTGGRVTAREALALVYPTVLETSKKPVLLIITRGTDITAEGRSGNWEFVFHFPARAAQGVYGLEPSDPEMSDSVLRLRFRLSSRPDAKGEDAALSLDFIDSPEAARNLSRDGVDWVAGDPDMALTTKRLSSGEAVWATESYGQEFTTAFVTPVR